MCLEREDRDHRQHHRRDGDDPGPIPWVDWDNCTEGSEDGPTTWSYSICCAKGNELAIHDPQIKNPPVGGEPGPDEKR